MGTSCAYEASALPPTNALGDSTSGDGDTGADSDLGPDTNTIDTGPRPDSMAMPDGSPPDGSPLDGGTDTSIPTTARSCREILDAVPSAMSGAHTIVPMAGGASLDVYCDMTTDGGGWTLVSSSRGEPPADVRSGHFADLATLDPISAHRRVADILRPVITDLSDMRFACKSDPSAAEMRVDLSFYDVPWYRTVTTGTDAESCFSENDGRGYDRPAPARRNNLDGATRPVGDDWDRHGYLEGEDSCGSSNDFTVDFDDRGIDSDQDDGTDWGDDDNSRKCGVDDLPDGVWYVFVRE